MSSEQLDAVDRGILHLLQEDARNSTPVDMAKQLPVTDGTVRNRIESMEERDIIEGYVPLLNYENAGFPLVVVFTCTVPPGDQEAVADEALQTRRVVNVRELLASQGNVEVVGIATGLSDIVTIATELTTLGLEIETQKLVRNERVRPFNHFGEDVVEKDD